MSIPCSHKLATQTQIFETQKRTILLAELPSPFFCNSFNASPRLEHIGPPRASVSSTKGTSRTSWHLQRGGTIERCGALHSLVSEGGVTYASRPKQQPYPPRPRPGTGLGIRLSLPQIRPMAPCHVLLPQLQQSKYYIWLRRHTTEPCPGSGWADRDRRLDGQMFCSTLLSAACFARLAMPSSPYHSTIL